MAQVTKLNPKTKEITIVEIPDDLTVYVPESVTMRQLHLAMLGANMIDAVSSGIGKLTKPARDIMQIEWDRATIVTRSFPILTMLNLTSAQIDALFIAAATK
jgi:anionic cell wall polymer biosynthesis LytR-Cps2A-Psr (LCP) family protein